MDLFAFAYFCYRYFLKGLSGQENGLYLDIPTELVDAKIFEVKKACGNDKEAIKEYIKRKWNICL